MNLQDTYGTPSRTSIFLSPQEFSAFSSDVWFSLITALMGLPALRETIVEFKIIIWKSG